MSFILASLDAEESHPLACFRSGGLELPVVFCHPPVFPWHGVRVPQTPYLSFPLFPSLVQVAQMQGLGMAIQHDERGVTRHRFMQGRETAVEALECRFELVFWRLR